MIIGNRLTMNQCQSISKQVLNHHIGSYFSYPIKEDDPSFPGYFNVVKTPMDLSTIITKINSKLYKNADEWYQDMHLMFDNVKKYYGKGAYFTALSLELYKFFEKQLRKALSVTNESYLENAKRYFEKLDKLLLTPPPLYSEGFNIAQLPQIEVTADDKFEFAVAASLLTSKTDVLAMTQILDANGYNFEHKEEDQSINMNEVPDQAMKELITYAKQRFKSAGAPYPKKGDSI